MRDRQSQEQHRKRLNQQHGISRKPPKRRWNPGEFVRDKRDKQLYCIIQCYRLVDDSHEWLYRLEERKDLGSPDLMIDVLCMAIRPPDMAEVAAIRVINEPIHRAELDRYYSIWAQIGARGNQTTVPNKTMLHHFEMVSSGEVEVME